MTERQVLRYGLVLTVLAILWLCGGCAFPERTIRGTLIAVQHDNRYEAPCGIHGAITRSCDEVPVCCSYRMTVVDSTGHTFRFWSFWPRYALGILGLVPLGGIATFHLHVHQLYDLQSCSEFGCPDKMEYTLDSDGDVQP